MKILLVEDNLNIRESLEYSFKVKNINLISKSNIKDTLFFWKIIKSI